MMGLMALYWKVSRRCQTTAAWVCRADVSACVMQRERAVHIWAWTSWVGQPGDMQYLPARNRKHTRGPSVLGVQATTDLPSASAAGQQHSSPGPGRSQASWHVADGMHRPNYVDLSSQDRESQPAYPMKRPRLENRVRALRVGLDCPAASICTVRFTSPRRWQCYLLQLHLSSMPPAFEVGGWQLGWQAACSTPRAQVLRLRS